MKKKVVLLNPPGQEDVIRDYYCGHLAKGKYLWPPLDLLVISGHLRDFCDCIVLDAVVTKTNKDKTIAFLKSCHPDAVVCLVAAVSWHSDIDFLKKIKGQISTKIIVSGDYPRAYFQEVLEKYTFIDAVLLDFTECELSGYICKDGQGLFHNVITRNDSQSNVAVERKIFSYPVPQYDLFSFLKYHLPHVRYHPFVPFLTTFSCMHSCIFCPFERIPFKLRDMGNVEEELVAIRSKKIKELLLKDQSFGSHEQHAKDFCQLMEKMASPFSWSCEMRVDAANESLLQKMKKTGCHTVMFGVESATEEVLQRHRKGIHLLQVREAFSLAKKLKLRTLAHVMIGMDGENKESQEKLIQFCFELDPQYVSFNVAAPLWNTTFRDRAQQEGRIFNDKIEVDSSYEYPVWESDFLSAGTVHRLHQAAMRRFYFRPSYMAREFLGAKSLYRRKMMLREGMNLLLKLKK